MTTGKIQFDIVNKRLEETNTKLDNANKELASFTYISSHGLREPLRKIHMFSDIILKEEEKNLSEKGKNVFRRMQRTSNNMQKLLDDLLTFFNSQNFLKQDYETLSLNIVVDDIRMRWENVIKQKKVAIRYGHICDVSVMPFQFDILINNLISNALKFTHPQRAPRIIIESKLIDRKEMIGKILLPQEKYYHISIQDNGIGFDNQYKSYIFDFFHRLHNNDQYEGSGIGLAICKKIVENHNGIIIANGVVDKGARFDIFIPA
jgi:light-regulated signal transduction histidine kinase (bacteriophytochrome)